MSEFEKLVRSPEDELIAKAPIVVEEVARLKLARTIVMGNFGTLVEIVDGDIYQDAWVVVHESREPKTVARTLFQHLHNYLAALYSFNEHVRRLVDERTEYTIRKRDLSPHLGDTPSCAYVEQLAFLRGLRHSMQHGDFRALDFQCVDAKRSFGFWEVAFDRATFESGAVAYPRSFLQYGNPDSMEQPLRHVGNFHRTYFLEFARDCLEWFEDRLE